jgi:hypothetical protein
MLHESVIWQPVAPDNMPDADLVVNVAIEGGEEPIWLGSWDGECWRDTEGMEIRVTHWADMLQGPSAAGVRVLAAPLPRASDEQVLEWAKRHDLPRWDNITDCRAAFEDAQTLHLAAGVDLPAPAQPVGWLDSFGELHKRREDAWDGDPDSTPPRPVYEQPAAGVKGGEAQEE